MATQLTHFIFACFACAQYSKYLVGAGAAGETATWFDEVAVAATAHALGVRIAVVSSNASNNTGANGEAGVYGVPGSPLIRIGNIVGLHYGACVCAVIR